MRPSTKTPATGIDSAPFLQPALRLGRHDAQEGLRRPQLYPQVAQALGIKVKLDPVSMGMVMSSYRAGFDTADL